MMNKLHCGSSSSGAPKRRREGTNLQADVNSDYARVSARKVISTRWAVETFLSREGLKEDFDMMANNAGMDLFASLAMDTFDQYT
jgi:hypothetical protein